ncbi:caspase family protein [Streptomyces violaceus]|uniref:caspase, EACC1-associated type n=1 Tax=Streptomyces violaceus TaxID=1936 RepID=UPI002E295972|nr:caspase family protein [Streptomyces violaceus]
MAVLPDPSRSEALLVGVHEYSALPALPAVARNLEGLSEVLTDPGVWGLPADRCTVLSQPESAQQVLDTVKEAATRAEDTLLIYYAGHGLVDPHTDELYLALSDSVRDREYTALRYEYLRRAVLLDPAVSARRTVVILDCCYSGRALVGRMSASDHIADRAMVEGTCLLTASAETRVSLSPPGETYTAFTGELITALAQGIPGAPDLIDMNTLYRHLHRTLAAKSRPLPQQRNRNTGGLIALARNRHGTVRTPPRPTAPPAPARPPALPASEAPPVQVPSEQPAPKGSGSRRSALRRSRVRVAGALLATLVMAGGVAFALRQFGTDGDADGVEPKGGSGSSGASYNEEFVARWGQPRGDILVGGKPVTGSKKSQTHPGTYKRTYIDGKVYAPLTGYGSHSYGLSGLEAIYDDLLTGTDPRLDKDSGERAAPGKVITTIDADVQRGAYEALRDREGAALAIDPSNGEILAMVSTPSYDPGTFSGATKSDGDAFKKLQKDVNPDNPMLNRALRETYPPRPGLRAGGRGGRA